VSGAGALPMRALTASTAPVRVGIARCSGLGWRWARRFPSLWHLLIGPAKMPDSNVLFI
jgi:hypothetical protein